MKTATVFTAGMLLLAAMVSFPALGAIREIGPGVTSETNETKASFAASFAVDSFVLPEDARVLVVVEGTGGSDCTVYAYERKKTGETASQTGAGKAAGPGAEPAASWELYLKTAGYLGQNGMNSHRVMGDKTTPIGLFQMNTPFGQAAPLSGFPENYTRVSEDYVWADATNSLVRNPSLAGERVGTADYAEYYDYAIDMGFNKNAVANQGAALFLHCHGHGRTETSGCVSIPKESMAEIMRLYGKYGDGMCYIALAPRGTFSYVYDSYGANNGLSPDGNFDGGL